MKVKPSNVDGIVDQINETREAEFWRDPDRPSTKFVPARRKQDPKIVKAKGRTRTAAWRNACDRLGRPEAREIGMAMVTALVRSEHLLDMTEQEVTFVSAALADLESRGFDRAQTLGVLRRLRSRVRDPDGRKAAASETPETAIVVSSPKTQAEIF
jgi:hypothetical protein